MRGTMLLNILVGLAGLGIVVFVHEFGHLLGAKACGIQVEAFSIGWGKKLVGFKSKKGTEYCLSLFPLGGYCRMKGEKLFQEALEADSREIPREPGTLFGAHPLKRVITYLAGPLGNLVFSIVILSLVWMVGFTTYTYGNRIILAADYPVLTGAGAEELPAEAAGFRTGDQVISVQGHRIATFADFQDAVAPYPDETLTVVVLREDGEHTLTVTPALDRDSGTGKIGVSAWIDPVVGWVEPGSAADLAGLADGDRIVRANGLPVNQQMDLAALLTGSPRELDLQVERGGSLFSTVLIPLYGQEGNPSLGLGFRQTEILSRETNPLAALADGTAETFRTLFLTIKSLGLLFRGINLGEAVSGPLRITYFAGEIASQGFSLGIAQGFTSFFRFLSLISVALFFMNLLPIPLLDGGMILVNFISLFRKKGINPRHFYRYQMVGLFILVMLILFTTFSDIHFFVNR